MKTTATRNLNDGSVLTVEVENGQYNARVSSDTRNLGFDGDSGELQEDETAETIASEIVFFRF